MNKSYGESDINLKLWIELSRLNLVIGRNIFTPIKTFDLSPVQFAVLEALYHKGQLSVGQIKDSILTTSGNLTVVINNLEKRNLISSCPGEDRRVKLIDITEEGARIIEGVFPSHVELLDEILNFYEEDEKIELITLLSRLRENILEEKQ